MCDEIEVLLKKRNFPFFPGPWKIAEGEYGRGILATKNINEGEIIFKDLPILTGPRFVVQIPICVTCLEPGKPLKGCSKNCRLPVCSDYCQDSPEHEPECKFLRERLKNDEPGWSTTVFRLLTPVRCLLMSEKDKNIVKNLHTFLDKDIEKQVEQFKSCLSVELTPEENSWLIHCCGVLNGTAFEIQKKAPGDLTFSLRGLYPLAALLNHNCSPNSRHYYSKSEGTGCTMCVIATKNISQGEEITTHYCSLLWATTARRHYLMETKHFLCNCQRCKDPTEFGTDFSAVICPCKGLLRSILPLDLKSKWQCDTCRRTIAAKDITLAQTLVARSGNHKNLPSILPPNNSLIVRSKLNNIWTMGEKNSMKDAKDEELDKNETEIRDIISLFEKLKFGESRMRGLLFLELYKTLQEKLRRNVTVDEKEIFESLQKARRILNDDITAPTIEINDF